MLDAYAVRKAIPRIVLAVIGINLSIYLCLALVDIINVVSLGMTNLMVAPFHTANLTAFDVPLDKSNSIVGGVGLFIAGKSLIGAVSGALAAEAGLVTVAMNALLFLLIPIAFLALSIVITVVIRQALLFFLVVTSPVAIACYVLPGTEKYFRQWWDLFLKTLLVFPIIAVIFALSDIFGSIIFSTNNGGLTGVAKIITGIIVIYAPLFLIPFAFRFAGGAIGKIVGAATGIGDRMGKMGWIKGRQEHYGQQYQDMMTRGKAKAFRDSKAIADNEEKSAFRRRAARYRMSRISGYKRDILQREAAMTERLAKEQEQQKNFGDDTDRRAYGIDMEAAQRDMEQSIASGSAVISTDSKGNTWRTSKNGRMRQKVSLDAAGNVDKVLGTEFRSLGGSWQTRSAVEQAEQRFGKHNTGQLQQTLAYEMSKAIEEGQQEELAEQYGDLTKAWNMDSSQAYGTWIGPAFNNQQEDLMYKNMTFDKNGKPVLDYGKYTREVYEKKGPQMLAYLKGKNIKELRIGHADAVSRLNASAPGSAEHDQALVELKMHESIMDTLAARGGPVASSASTGGPGAPSAPTGPTPTTVPTGGAPATADAEYGWTTGAGHTTDELKQYFSEVQEVARERSSTPHGQIRVPGRDPTATPVGPIESQAAEANPNRNRPRL